MENNHLPTIDSQYIEPNTITSNPEQTTKKLPNLNRNIESERYGENKPHRVVIRADIIKSNDNENTKNTTN